MAVMIDESLNLTTIESENALKRAFLPVDPDKWVTDDILNRVDAVLNAAQDAKVKRILAHRAKHAGG